MNGNPSIQDRPQEKTKGHERIERRVYYKHSIEHDAAHSPTLTYYEILYLLAISTPLKAFRGTVKYGSICQNQFKSNVLSLCKLLFT